MSVQDRTELIALLRKRVSNLHEGPFKHRMEARVKLLEEVPREAFIALALIILAMLGMWAYTKWAWRPLRALAVI
jgi:hypothetical protein